MRRVLIVCPHMPPANAVDAHRVRMLLPFLADNGWAAEVLTVNPEDLPFPFDEKLVQTLTDGDFEIRVVKPVSSRVAAWFGIRATGLRSWRAIANAGQRLLKARRFDLVFFSTTAFHLLPIGRLWSRRFKVPLVIDLQDPWVPRRTPRRHLRTGLKHRAMRTVHRLLEWLTIPHCAGVMAVSEHYIDDLRRNYAQWRARTLVLPFGVARRDIEAAAGASACSSQGVFIGAVADSMLPLIEALCVALRRADGPPLRFIGTRYAGRETVVLPIARRHGVAHLVAEQPERVGYIDALATMRSAPFTVVLGSTEAGYVPSKWFNVLATARRIVLVAHAHSPWLTELPALWGVEVVTFTDAAEPQLVEALAAALARVGDKPNAASDPGERVPQAYWASAQAAQVCAFFEQVREDYQARQAA